MRVGVVCSNDTQVRMFAPVVEALRERRTTVALMSLDSFYGQGATGAAREFGLDVLEPAAAGGPDAQGGFYTRPVLRIWRDVINARPTIDRALGEMDVDRIVLGNDSGLIEKLVIAMSFARSVGRTILVQDGRLAEGRPKAAGLAGRLVRTAKRSLSRPLRWVGAPYLASSEYGEGGAAIICASGSRSARLLARRSRGTARVLVTGQPRYDRLVGMLRDRSAGSLSVVAICTTPFRAAGLGSEPQRRQDEMIEGLHRRLPPNGMTVVVKPHPRESPEHYAALVGEANVYGGDPAAVLAEADVAIIGISTLVEEAAILGCPVLTPGTFLHGERFTSLLPDPDAFPAIDTLPAMETAILQLADAGRRIQLARRQQTAMVEEAAFSPEHPAAEQVADAILSP